MYTLNKNNFKDTGILQEFYENANSFLQKQVNEESGVEKSLSYPDFISNIDINKVVGFLGSDLLSLIKMLILEK